MSLASRFDQHGNLQAPQVGLAARTLVYDKLRSSQVMWLDGLVVPPVGATVELTDPNADATVVSIRLVAGDQTTDAVHVHRGQCAGRVLAPN